MGQVSGSGHPPDLSPVHHPFQTQSHAATSKTLIPKPQSSSQSKANLKLNQDAIESKHTIKSNQITKSKQIFIESIAILLQIK